MTGRIASLLAFSTVLLCGCTAPTTRTAAYDVRQAEVALPLHSLPITLITPKDPRIPGLMVLYATGDDGWSGTNEMLLEHMAQGRYTIAAFDSSTVVDTIRNSGGSVTLDAAAIAVEALLEQAKRRLGLPETAPTIVTGFSRGASLVVLAAGEPSLQRHIIGGVAVALTRESDYLEAPQPDRRSPSLLVDGQGRLLTYPAIARLGSLPIAVIQSARDDYVPAEESRRLFGPDTATRRLYEIDAKDHAFSDAHEALLQRLDAALAWIAPTARPGA